MANTKKKTKTTRITKTDRLRMAAEKTRPTGITVAVGRQYEVEIVPMYDPFTHKRMAGVRADQWGDPMTPPPPPSTWTARTSCESLHRL